MIPSQNIRNHPPIMGPQIVHQRQPSANTDSRSTAHSGVLREERHVSQERIPQQIQGALSRERSQEIIIQPGNICLDNTGSASNLIDRTINIHPSQVYSNAQSSTVSSNHTPRDQAAGSHSTRGHTANLQISEPRGSEDIERIYFDNKTRYYERRGTQEHREQSDSSNRSTVGVVTDRTSQNPKPDLIRRRETNQKVSTELDPSVAYSTNDRHTQEMMQMKEMHALLLHRECQSLAARVVKLEKELEMAQEIPKLPTADKSTATDFISSEYSSVRHCCTCNGQEQDQMGKCTIPLTRLFFQRRKRTGY